MNPLFLGFDLETDTADPATTKILEVGAVLYDFGSHTPVAVYDELVKGIPVPPTITELTHIQDDYCNLVGKPLDAVIQGVLPLFGHATAVIAHNGIKFDRPVFERQAKDCGLIVPERPWIDTLLDPPYPATTTSRKLGHLASDHGIIHQDAHRAVFDVMTTLRLAERYDINELLTNATSPTITVVANVNFDRRTLASERGFHWDREQRWWVKTIRTKAFETEKGEYPFTYQVFK